MQVGYYLILLLCRLNIFFIIVVQVGYYLLLLLRRLDIVYYCCCAGWILFIIDVCAGWILFIIDVCAGWILFIIDVCAGSSSCAVERTPESGKTCVHLHRDLFPTSASQ